MSLPTSDIMTIIGLSIILLVAALMVYFIILDVFKLAKDKSEKKKKKIKSFSIEDNTEIEKEELEK